MPTVAGETTPLTSKSSGVDDGVPRGAWKDGIFGCFSLGLCHPSLWCAWCCPQILMGQVLTRMNMSWLGERDSPEAVSTFRKVVYVVVAYYVLSSIFAPAQPQFDEDKGELIRPDVNPLSYLIYQAVNACFGLYSLIVMVKLRAAVRERYTLPDQTPCGDMLEDICCVCCCGCCTISQLARHTADYEERRAVWCSSTGLPPNRNAVQLVV